MPLKVLAAQAADFRRLSAQVVLEVGCDHAQLAQSTGLELAHPLAGDAELATDLFERPRCLSVEAEASAQNVAHTRIQLVERDPQLDRTYAIRRGAVGRLRFRVFDQVAVETLAVADRSLQA